MEIIDMTPIVEFIFQQVAIVVTLAVFMVGINNKVKELVPAKVKPFMAIISILLGIGLMYLLRASFLIETSHYLTVFYGMMIGLTASGLYDAGLGKAKEEVLVPVVGE